MPALGLSVNPLIIIYTVLAAAGIGVLIWAFDAIGDQREQKVWKKINAAIEATNADVRQFNDLDGKIRAVAEQARQKGLAEGEQINAGKCEATEPQAKALSRIR